MTEQKYQYLYRVIDTADVAVKPKNLTDYNWTLTSHITERDMIKTAKSLARMYYKLGRYIEYRKLTVTSNKLIKVEYDKKEE